MSTRRLRSLLWWTTACLLLATSGVVVWVIQAPPEVPPEMSPEATELPASSIDPANLQPQDTNTPQASTIDHQALQAVSSRNFRQRLFDPPPPPEVKQPPKPLPRVELLSTTLRSEGSSGGTSVAWVRDGQATRKVSSGDTVGPATNPATITEIQADRILIDHESGPAEITRSGTKPLGGQQ